MLVRLKVKLAEVVNGVDLSHCAEGDLVEMPEGDAAMLIAEGWAEPATNAEAVSRHPKQVKRDVAADKTASGGRFSRER